MILYIGTIALFVVGHLLSGIRENFLTLFNVFTAVSFVIALIVQVSKYYNQAYDIEEIGKETEKKEINKQESDVILPEFKEDLLTIYPEIEKSIFDKVTSGGTGLLVASNLGIKANEAIGEYLSELALVNSKIFDCDRRIAKLKMTIRLRARTCKLFCLPILPKMEGEKKTRPVSRGLLV